MVIGMLQVFDIKWRSNLFRHFLFFFLINSITVLGQSAFVSGFIESSGMSSSLGQLVITQVKLGSNSIKHGVQVPINFGLTVADYRTMELNLYPNPTSGDIIVTGIVSDEVDLFFYDLTGTLVDQIGTEMDRTIEVNLQNGMYYVSIFSKSGQQLATRKIIVSK